MNVIKTLACRIGHLLLSLVRGLRKVVCCRRKKEAEYLLPMTISHVNGREEPKISDVYEFKSQWEEWPEALSPPPIGRGDSKENELEKRFQTEEAGPDDFFKDMIPQFRKQKMLYIRMDDREFEDSQSPSNRLAMDPKAILTGPDLGIIDDTPSNWEDTEEGWDPDKYIREAKRIEREKRLAEHQRKKMEKKQEKESRRSSKTLNSLTALSLSDDSRDKQK